MEVVADLADVSLLPPASFGRARAGHSVALAVDLNIVVNHLHRWRKRIMSLDGTERSSDVSDCWYIQALHIVINVWETRSTFQKNYWVHTGNFTGTNTTYIQFILL